MTKSLGRTYSLLDFSGREMHYWRGNLPRRRVGVASPGTLYVRCYRALHSLVLVFRENAMCHPRRLFLFFSLASPWRSIRQSSRCAYIADVVLKGDARGLCRVCKVTTRACCSRRRRCRCQKVRTREILGARFIHAILSRNREDIRNNAID